MDKNIKNFLSDNILILDGATGTELQKRGMPTGVCPEEWIAENKDIMIEIQRGYVDSGSHAVLVPSFGGNRIKLSNYGLENKVDYINKKMVEISREAVGDKAYILGDMSTTGKFVEPFGNLPFEEAVNIYKEQAKALIEAGVDGIFIETMIDIQETRAAVLAIKEIDPDIFVFASMTYDEKGFTLTGTDPVTATITLQAIGADAVGMNCSTGPDRMVEFAARIKPIAKVPIFVKPNAGLPKLVNNKSVFLMTPEEFGSYLPEFEKIGINAIGGCCGTNKDHIAVVSNFFKGKKSVPPKLKENPAAVTSSRTTVFIGQDKKFVVIGERINPTGKKALKEELKEGKLNIVRKFALEQYSAGAHLLDVNVGVPGINEKEIMEKVVSELVKLTPLPLSIDSSDIEVFENILRKYPGRALINSISAEKEKLEKLLPLVKKYGSMFILLPLNEAGIPKTVDKRIELVNKVYKKAQEMGLSKNDILLDGLVMTISTGYEPGQVTLDLIEWATKNGINTTVGLSNVSFGLPNRVLINTTFLSMAARSGLTSAIINPNLEENMNTIYAINAIRGTDKNCLNYINRFNDVTTTKVSSNDKPQNLTPEELLFKKVVDGDSEKIQDVVKDLLNKGLEPQKIVDDILIPAIRKVGDLYDQKIYFLPQLMMSAKTMQEAFKVIEPLLKKNSNKKIGKVVIATVKGDIHDIGKNIVVLMLRNNGFEVIDLGKDVDSEKIVEVAEKEQADIIALSALMTTTMTRMPEVIKLAKERNLKVKVMVGGAVVDKEYAAEIGADGYSEDAASAAALARKLVEEKK